MGRRGKTLSVMGEMLLHKEKERAKLGLSISDKVSKGRYYFSSLSPQCTFAGLLPSFLIARSGKFPFPFRLAGYRAQLAFLSDFPLVFSPLDTIDIFLPWESSLGEESLCPVLREERRNGCGVIERAQRGAFPPWGSLCFAPNTAVHTFMPPSIVVWVSQLDSPFRPSSESHSQTH